MITDLSFFDNHMHLREDGKYIEEIKEFRKHGGKYLNYCPYTDVKEIIAEKSYLKCYERGLKIAQFAMEKVDVKIFLSVGPYPVDYIKMREILGKERAMELMKKGMEEAGKLCKEGKAIAIGEIGRPHFKVSDEVLIESNEIMKYGIEIAKDIDVPVILHMEGANQSNMKEISEIAKKIGIKKDKVIKHFSPPIIKEEENFGVFPSVIASEKNIEEAINKGHRFMLETDYLDDLRRPGAVLSLKTIPLKIKKLLREGKMSYEDAMIINKENPEKIYNIELQVK
ncbi:MAG: TatD family hydrolase [Thermoplasmatales archaeon]|nr:TatD family hydrolase [Thermoplasmatales archaeon]